MIFTAPISRTIVGGWLFCDVVREGPAALPVLDNDASAGIRAAPMATSCHPNR
jgi:hypothetical protein